jgi:hypothetical protein
MFRTPEWQAVDTVHPFCPDGQGFRIAMAIDRPEICTALLQISCLQ